MVYFIGLKACEFRVTFGGGGGWVMLKQVGLQTKFSKTKSIVLPLVSFGGIIRMHHTRGYLQVRIIPICKGVRYVNSYISVR